MAVTTILRPTTLKDAAGALREDTHRMPLAGGTFLARHTPTTTTGLIDMSALPLRYVTRAKGGVRIGALTTLAQMRDVRMLGDLAHYAGDVSTEPLRYAITLGGNVMIPLRWSDMPLLLSVCNARFSLYDGTRSRTVSADTFFSAHPRTHLRPGEFLKEISLPVMTSRRIVRKKCLRTHDDIPAIQIALSARIMRGKLTDVRAGYVCRQPLPHRMKKVEKLLEGVAQGAKVPAGIERQARSDAKDLSDMRYSSAYLEEYLGIYVMRLAERLLSPSL